MGCRHTLGGLRWGLLFAVLTVAACSHFEKTTINVQTAAKGTQIEARQVVALVYGQSELQKEEQLLYSGGELGRVLARIHGRYTVLKPLFDRGVVGNTVSGFVAWRNDPGSDDERELVRQENHDRALLYTQASVAVGHGTDNLSAWLPYASFTFGEEWIKQAPAGWWQMDEAGQWRQK